MRRFLSMIFVGVAVFAFATHAANASQQPSAADEDTVKIAFTGSDGQVQQTPYFNVEDAVPGMRPEHRTVTIANPGTVPVAYDFGVTVTREPGELSVADVLVVSIKDPQSGTLLYRGSLADVRVAGTTHIAPGQHVAHDMTISWPDGGPSDNRYQGLTTDFELTARARPLH